MSTDGEFIKLAYGIDSRIAALRFFRCGSGRATGGWGHGTKLKDYAQSAYRVSSAPAYQQIIADDPQPAPPLFTECSETGMPRSAIEDDESAMFIEILPLYWRVREVDLKRVPLGKARIGREGSDVTIISYEPRLFSYGAP